MSIIKTGNLGLVLSVDFYNFPFKRQPDAVIDNMKTPSLLGEMFSDKDNDGSYNFDYLNTQGFNNMAWCFYKLNPGCIVPQHVDHFINYMNYFKIKDRSKIVRTLIFLEDWQFGHYFEADEKVFKNWKAMDYVTWSHDTPHLGGNLGKKTRYTLQLTGTLS